jgi:signal transduction histidine kinase/ActR/RegA family two-component response regulator
MSSPNLMPRGQFRATSVAQGALRNRLSKGLSGKFGKVAFNKLGIPGRLALLVLALALPLNLVIAGVIWGLVSRANDAQRTSLLYTARSIAAAVDAELGKYVTLAESLALSPHLLDDKLDAFEVEARREFPAGGDVWALVTDVNGQQLLNTAVRSGQPLPRCNPLAIEALHQAMTTRSIVVSDVMRAPAGQGWIANIEVPIFKDGRPFRGLVVAIKQEGFLRLLSAHDIPTNWLVGIIDGRGRFIARIPQGPTEIGQPASEGWRAVKDQTGISEHSSLEGDVIVHANANPSISSWAVGLAVKKTELRALAWDTVRWAALLGAGFSAASLLLAGTIARQITGPIEQLRRSFAGISGEPSKPITTGPPEIMQLQDTLYRATVDRADANQNLTAALSKLEQEMELREETQVKLAQAQRMEAIGQLSGGVAHDFNNVLAAISGYLDVVALCSADRTIREAAQGAMDAVQMGASLTRRLLTLSRSSGVELETLDLNDRVAGTVELLKRTLGEHVTVTLKSCVEPCQTLANPGDVDNAILNLAINGRDAMPHGGLLTLETSNVTLDADAAARIPKARPGRFVVLSVSDTGQGMSPDVLKRAMEPFFTTKEKGYGTGLGLATVHSIVQQSGGFVAISSAIGKGTAVTLYFPKADSVPRVCHASPSSNEVPLGAGQLVLVVENSDAVRHATMSRLQSLGYAVVEARTGPEAIKLLETGKSVALIFSDIVMPGGMTGLDLAKWVCANKPALKVLLTSGYANSPAVENDGVRDIKVLAKPCTREQLAHAVREALHGHAKSVARGAIGPDVRGEPSTVIELRRPRRLR